MKSARYLLCSVIAASLASGCATMSQSDPAPMPAPAVADTQSARLADATARELAHLSRFDPDALDSVDPQLRALAAALATRDIAVSVETPGTVAADPPPPPEMDSARSVLHAIHLASYRRRDNAEAGWTTLSAVFPDILAGREARLEAVDIPDQGVFLRLKAGPFDTRAQAVDACRRIESAQAYCQVTDFTGQRLEGGG